MTAPETFTVSSKRPLTTGRRPDRTGVHAKADIPLRARNIFTARSTNSSEPRPRECVFGGVQEFWTLLLRNVALDPKTRVVNEGTI
jgi:hypothetical protein